MWYCIIHRLESTTIFRQMTSYEITRNDTINILTSSITFSQFSISEDLGVDSPELMIPITVNDFKKGNHRCLKKLIHHTKEIMMSSKINRTHKVTQQKGWFSLLPTLAKISSLVILSQWGSSSGFNTSLIVMKSPMPLKSWKANLVKLALKKKNVYIWSKKGGS